MDVQKNGFLSIEQVKDTYLKGNVSNKAKAPEVNFNDILKQKSQIMIPDRIFDFPNMRQADWKKETSHYPTSRWFA